LLESRPPRAAHPDRPSCVAVSVRPSSRQARRTAPPVFNGVNALAFGTLFSSQGASADPKEGTPKRWGRATRYCRHAAVQRQPRRRFAGSQARIRPYPPGSPFSRDPHPTHLAGAKCPGIGSKHKRAGPGKHRVSRRDGRPVRVHLAGRRRARVAVDRPGRALVEPDGRGLGGPVRSVERGAGAMPASRATRAARTLGDPPGARDP